MPHTQILANIAKHISLTQEEIFFFTSLLKEKQVSKKEFILKENQLCKYISFVERGTLRAYYADKDGKESTIMFAIADWWITDMYCFINKLPAMLHIQALETSTVFQLQKKDLDRLYT